ncbi:chalcone isomerase family protein [Pseudodesulfovibrio sp. zrk46]|uniref:chalcone isomerase family protein n=1 Tax=Pseudodesulfovibrio sp. zrk46 TaxID=2725288 RepID=UPI00144942C1|nr:chalcone isomerase family protein [Pseudodesulfovibrio sp. zrk46]QJB57842.1 hypothetical protein HFN16_16185 [Pseudodesulfovibrio sp. zrk46]
MYKIFAVFAAILITLVILAPQPSTAAEKAGGILVDSQMVDDQQLVLNGLALREKFVFDVYVAALYLPKKTSDPKTILADDTPRMMTMHFLRNVDAKAINEAWLEGLNDNTPNATQELKAKFEQLADMMVDMKKDDVMGFTYSPTSGTAIMVAGQPKGGIPGKDFADAILATWIGPNPGPGTKFKQAILGN